MKLKNLLVVPAGLGLALGLAACGGNDAPAAAPTTVTVTETVTPPPASTPPASTPPASTPSAPASGGNAGQVGADGDDVTDQALRAELSTIALGEVGSGTVTDVEYNRPDGDDDDADDRDHAYEVDVDLANGDDVTVDIAENMSVVRVDR